MVEPHLFTGPEFVLEVPSDHPQPIQSHVLQKLQAELYSLLTPTARRKVHATYSGSSGGSNSGSLPPPPDHLLLHIVSTIHTDVVKDEGTTQFLLLVTDSRVAAEIFSIGLRNPFIALSYGMRLCNHYTGAGGKARSTPAEILRKKESLRSRMNFDEDLWETLQKALTPEWMQEFETRYKRIHEGDVAAAAATTAAALMRDSERHEQRVENLLCYCEQEVKYVGVMDEDGNAAPFLLAMGAFYRLGLTYRDALVHFVRHPRRTIRALALFIVRYTAAPEELEPFFAPSLTDEVTIACAEDVNTTTTMRKLCEDLLLCDEVCEAWPPTYHKYWIEHKVRPMMQRIEVECKRREELRQARANDGNTSASGNNNNVGRGGGMTAAATDVTPTKTSSLVVKKDTAQIRGCGKGVGVFGFHNLNELHAYVKEKERVLVPQRILSMSVVPRGEDGADNDYYDYGDDEDADDDDDDFMIKVRLEGGKSSWKGGSAHKPQKVPQERQKVERGTERRKRARKSEIMTNTRSLVVTGAYRTVLRLLGRTEPFDRREEHYLKF